jgi:hypothetical protein
MSEGVVWGGLFSQGEPEILEMTKVTVKGY